MGKNSRVNGGPRFSHRPFKLSDRGGGVQGYRRTRECVPARPKLAELVRLRLPFYDRFLHAFGAVPHAGASFAGALPARGTAQTRDGGIVLNPSDWRESGTPRFSSGGLCAACTPLAFFGIVGKGGGSGRRRTICAVGQGGGIAAAPVRPCAFCPAAFRILRRGLLHKALAQISPLSILKIYSTTSGETGTHGPVACPAAVEIVRDHSGAAIGI